MAGGDCNLGDSDAQAADCDASAPTADAAALPAYAAASAAIPASSHPPASIWPHLPFSTHTPIKPGVPQSIATAVATFALACPLAAVSSPAAFTVS